MFALLVDELGSLGRLWVEWRLGPRIQGGPGLVDVKGDSTGPWGGGVISGGEVLEVDNIPRRVCNAYLSFLSDRVRGGFRHRESG